MKVKCIENDGWNNFLTIGKFYEVTEEDDAGYIIIDDYGGECWFPKECFKTLSELRNETINKLLEDES